MRYHLIHVRKAIIKKTISVGEDVEKRVPCAVLAEKAMAPHPRTPAWRIPWTEEPGGLQSMGSLRVGHD